MHIKTQLLLIFLSCTSIKAQTIEKYLLIVNDIPLNQSIDFLNAIPKEKVRSISIYDSATATFLYGEFIGKSGVVLIESSKDVSGIINIPTEFILRYGNGEPIVLINGILTDYEDAMKIQPDYVSSIEISKGIRNVKTFGLQSINGVVLIRTR